METPFSLPATKPNFLPIVRETASFKLQLKHIAAWVRVNAATVTTCTMDALPVTEAAEGIIEQQTTTGVITFSPGSGCSGLRCRGGTTITTNAQYAVAMWKWDPVERVYIITGDLTVSA